MDIKCKLCKALCEDADALETHWIGNHTKEWHKIQHASKDLQYNKVYTHDMVAAEGMIQLAINNSDANPKPRRRYSG